MDLKRSVESICKVMFFSLFIIASLFSDWSQDIRLTNDPNISQQNLGCARWLAVSGGTVYVIWVDTRSGSYDLYYKISPDSGKTWGSAYKLTNGTLNNYCTATIAVWKDTVHVAWMDIRGPGGSYDIYYRRSTDGGLTWEPETCLVSGSADFRRPALAVWKNYVYLVYVYLYNSIRFKRSTDGGVTWGNDIIVVSSSYWAPSIFAVDSFVHISWHNSSNSVYYRRSSNYGVNWGSAHTIYAPSGQLSEATCITSSPPYVHMIWHDNVAGGKLYYARSTDNGNTWEQAFVLSPNFSGTVGSSIISSDSNVYVAWNSNHTGTYQIYYKYSNDNGLTWSSDTQLTTDLSTSYLPHLAFSNSIIYLTWTDNRDGNTEIYFKKNDFGLTGIVIQRPHLKKEKKAVGILGIETFFDDNLNLTFLNSCEKSVHLILYSASGRTVIRKTFPFVPKKLTVETPELPSGVYFLNVEVDREYRLIEKLLKK